jgi:hypothetical protein
MTTLSAAAVATLVFCAPGYPGGASDAQPLLDQFAHATVAAAGWPPASLVAVYDPTEEGGLAKLRAPDATLAFVPYPFFVEHGSELQLTPLAQADMAATGPTQHWTLIAKSGRVTSPASMAGFTILSVAGYAPNFVRHSALGSWPLPPDVRIEFTGQILSALRRAAAGEPVAALLDQEQAAALPSLPFANELKSVVQSAELPVAVVAVLDSRLPAARARALQTALLRIGHAAGDTDTLASLRLKGFVPVQLPGQKAAP